MPMVRSSRFSGSRIISMDYTAGSFNGFGYTLDAATAYQDVYSFRTGHRADSDEGFEVKLDPLSETYSPPQGNLVEALVYRKKFLERQISYALSRPGAPSHFLLGDVGHEFATRKCSIVGSDNQIYHHRSDGSIRRFRNVFPLAQPILTSDGRITLTGPYLDSFSNYFSALGFPSSTAGTALGPTSQSLRASASSHISEMNPFKGKASILASLLELARGDIPNILKSLRQNLVTINGMKASGIKDASQALGSEYLNNVFGWSPIIRDIESALKTLLSLDALLFPEDSTRRKVERVISTRGAIGQESVGLQAFSYFNINESSVTSKPGKGTNKVDLRGSTSFSNSWIEAQPADVSVVEEYSVFTTARFQTSARPSAANNGYLDRAIELLSLELTPEVLWQITPWSWLIDWFSNMGAVISNLTDLGLSNTILNYAYATGRVKQSAGMTVKPQVASSFGIKSFNGNFIYSFESDLKLRIAASPFGFDVSLGQLNEGQWGILAALGLARSR